MPASFIKYRAKPVIIEAIKLTKDNAAEVKALLGEHNTVDKPWDPVNLHINTGEGVVTAEPGTWIIKDVRGKFYPCVDQHFQARYEEITQTSQNPSQNPRKPV